MHDTHFLDRLSRVSRGHCDVALALYRNPDLIAYLLANAPSAARVERVAIALDETPNPPHLIVTSEGRFVTCLGEGMSLDGTPVIAFGQLQALRRAHERNERGTALLNDTGTQGKGGLGAVFDAMLEGARMSREDAEGLLAIAPLLPKEFARIGIEEFLALRARYGRWGRRVTASNEAALTALGKRLWLVAHSLTATGEALRHIGRQDLIATSLLGLSFHLGSFAHCYRAVWVAARAGKAALRGLKDEYRNLDGYATYFGTFCALLAIAVRHSSLRAEIFKLLETEPRAPGQPEFQELIHADAGFRRSLARMCFDREDPSDIFYDTARDVTLDAAKALPDGNPYAFRNKADIPAAIATPVLCAQTIPLWTDMERKAQLAFVAHLPVVALLEPEDFFLPREAAVALLRPPDAVEAMLVLNGARIATSPDRVAPTPPPNAPCSCGSGRKYKRCCGLDAA